MKRLIILLLGIPVLVAISGVIWTLADDVWQNWWANDLSVNLIGAGVVGFLAGAAIILVVAFFQLWRN